MDKENLKDLLDALDVNMYTVIIAVIQAGELIDWVPATEYSMLQEAKIDHDWPQDAEILLLYGLDALLRYSTPAILFNHTFQ